MKETDLHLERLRALVQGAKNRRDKLKLTLQLRDLNEEMKQMMRMEVLRSSMRSTL